MVQARISNSFSHHGYYLKGDESYDFNHALNR
jgi:hypothetical protein